ncbi:MAG: ABC transporter substrate-binding protein [Sphaerospermopsis sp. SIO1G1]|nr:ABC transporter substrate-binding protein [Sphaerospermopsis sp. SIO1G1]
MNISFKSQRNPYILGRPIDQHLLFGRKSLFSDISHYLQQHKQIIVLYGQRRIGKSSVVRNINHELKDLQEKFAFVRFSLEYYSQKSLGGILAELAKEITIGLSLEPENIQLPEVTELESDSGIFSDEFLPQVYQALKSRNLVLLLDDIDIFINNHPEIPLKLFYENLFSVIQKQNKLFIILLMDHKLLKDSQKLSKFNNVVIDKEIKLLDQNDTTDLIKQPAQNILEYGDDAIQAIFNLSAGHPYFTQVICFAIFSRARENNKLDGKVYKEDVEAIIDKAIELAEAGLSWFWHNFSVPEKVVLSAVAESQDTSEDYLDLIKKNKAYLDINRINIIKKAQEYLKENEFLDQTKDEKIKIALFRKWIIQTHPLNEEISELEKLTQKENQGDAKFQGTNINENNNVSSSQLTKNTNTIINSTNRNSIHSDTEIDIPINNPESDHVVNTSNTPQKKPPILIITGTIVGLFIASIIVGMIFRILSTQPCPAGEKKEFWIRCVVDTSRISSGDKPLFSNISRFRDDGIQAFKKGDYQQAEDLFKQAVKSNKFDVESGIYYNNALARQQGSPFSLAVVVPVDSKTNQDNAKEILRGVAQAQDQFNQNQGLNGRLLEVVIGNDSNKSEEAKEVVNEIIKDSSILGVIGHNSGEVTKSVLQDYENANLAIISPTNTKTDLKSSVFFRVINSDKITGQKLAKYVYDNLKLKRVVIFANSQNPSSKSVSEEFTKDFQNLGGKVVQEYSFTSSFFGDMISESVNKYQAEAAMLFPDTENTDNAIEIAKANLAFYKDQDKPERQMLRLLGVDTLYSYDTLLKGDQAVEGMILSVPWFRETPAAKDFAQKSAEIWGGNISWRTATSYDATQAFITALSPNASRTKILENLQNVKLSKNETSGYSLQFTQERERQSEPVFVEIKNGQFVQKFNDQYQDINESELKTNK